MVSAYVLLSGFRALSDDDFSRVVIAQSFAAHPSLDPSGTSWLPFPFWLYGACLSVFGTSLHVARAIAFVIGLLAVCGIWLAGRWMGLSRGQSLLGASLSCMIPYAAWLGVATTPDILNATLLLIACASLCRGNPRMRGIGALALVAATLSRYESWPVAVIWAGITGFDAARRKRWAQLALAMLALAAPLWWMTHGILHHHDALFFVKRVSSYRRALGLAGSGSVTRLLATPEHGFLDAPMLWILLGTAVAFAFAHRAHPWRRRWLRPVWAMLAMLTFLVIGDWRDSAATHHVGRTLLPLWFFVSLVVAKLLARIGGSALASRAVAVAAVLGSFCVGLVIPLPDALRVDAFCPRAAETEGGLRAAAIVPRGQRLAIQTSDYGYFALQAAFARPNDAVILDRHDPRSPSNVEAFSSANALSRALARSGVGWIVVPRAQRSKLPPNSEVHWQSENFVLAQVTSRAVR